jgi:hypothetical protein
MGDSQHRTVLWPRHRPGAERVGLSLPDDDAAALQRPARRGTNDSANETTTLPVVPLIAYVKDEDNFGKNREAVLDAMARLVNAGTVVAIKYAVVRPDPEDDPYLDGLLARVDRRRVISGMGERPAVAHFRHRGLPGFTTGSGSVAPSLSQSIFEAASRGDWAVAEDIRARFLPLEDVRDEWGPARVLHAAVEEAGLAATGPIPPFVTELDAGQRAEVRAVAQALAGAEALAQRGARCEPAPQDSGAAPQPSLVRRQGSALLRSSIAREADGLFGR